MKSRYLGEYPRLLSGHHDALLAPRMAHVRHYDSEVGEPPSNRLDMDGPAEINRALCRVGRAHMEGEGQVVGDAVLVNRDHPRMIQRHAIVYGSVFHPSKTVHLDCV